MTGTDPSPLVAVEVSLRRLRLVAAPIAIGTSIAQRSESSFALTLGASMALAIALLVANAASRRMMKARAHQARLVGLQLVLDILVTTGALIVFAPEPSGMAWVIIGLPVLEGAMRYRLVGAVGAWLAVATILCTHVIVVWTPGSGVDPLLDLAQPLLLGLALGVPAGYLADRLTAELVLAAEQNEEMQRRSRLLAVLTIAGQDFADADQRTVMATAVEATQELGYSIADIGVWDSQTLLWQRAYARPGMHDAMPDASDLEVEASQTMPGSVVLAEACHLTLLASEGSRSLILRALVPEWAWGARDEAFAVLAAKAAASLSTAIRQEQLVVAQRNLHHDATHDHLTGLLNRAGLVAELVTCMQRSAENDGASCAVMYMDLNSFKNVNDTYGHEVGDHVLEEVADRLRGHLPRDASIARFGGDEFVVVLPNRTDDEVFQLRDRVDRVICDPIEVDGQQLQIGSSTGIHVVDDPAASPAEVLRKADSQMYERKRNRLERNDLQDLSELDVHAIEHVIAG